mgnify:CR=1 FL=1
MPRIYLSPSTQDWNPYVDGSGSEEYWMNLLADTLEPYLYANTISFVRNTPEMTAASSIAQANSLGGFDFYLALHSNASGEGQAGKNRGIIVFYYPTSSDGKRAAELFAAQLRMVYPLPAKVTTQATTTLGEVRRPRYPANLIELGYHDNYDDARWIENNLDAAAQAIARDGVFRPAVHLPAARAHRRRHDRGLSPAPAKLPGHRRGNSWQHPERRERAGLRELSRLVLRGLRRPTRLRGAGLHCGVIFARFRYFPGATFP